MKCLCGHEHNLRPWDDGYDRKQDFIRVYSSNDITHHIYDEEDDKLKVELYACPKCGTVRLEQSY